MLAVGVEVAHVELRVLLLAVRESLHGLDACRRVVGMHDVSEGGLAQVLARCGR